MLADGVRVIEKMGPFQFRLKSLLRLRELARDEARLRYGEAVTAQETLAQAVGAVEQELAALQEEVRRHSAPGPLDVDRTVACHRYQLVLNMRRQQLLQQLSSVQAEVDRRREVWSRAEQEVAVLKKLRERQEEKYRYDVLRQEQKQLDDSFRRQEG
jgi:flagellar export protein FliJ